jgi:hypothetical protein
MDGITVVKKIWDGRANIAEYKADGPGGHVELISLRWYNPAAHQWNLDFATPNVGTLGIPAVGEFKNGRADFYDENRSTAKQSWCDFQFGTLRAIRRNRNRRFHKMAENLGSELGQ